MKMGARLGIFYGLLIAILAAVGWLGLSRMQKIDSEMRGVVTCWDRLKLVQSAVAKVNANGRLTLESSLVRDKTQLGRIQDEIEVNKRETTRLIEEIERNLDEDASRALLNGVKQARVPYVESLAKVKFLSAQGRMKEASDVIARETIPRLAVFNGAWDAFVAVQGELVEAASRDSSAAYQRARVEVVVLIVLAFILAILIFSAFNRLLAARIASDRRKAVGRAAFLSSSKEDNVTTIVQGVLQNICEALDWRQGAYWVIDGGAAHLRCAGFWSQQERGPGEFEAISRSMTFSSGIGLPGRVWQQQAPAWIEDVTRDANFPRAPLAQKEGLHGAFGFPVIVGGKFHGVLEFFSGKIEKPDDELLEMMATAGEQLGLFIEHKQTEEAFKKSRLQQSEKMAAVGQLAAGVAHELNNPLGIILGFSQALVKRADTGDPLLHPLKSIEREALRCKNLVVNLLTFSRTSKAAMEEFDLNELIIGTLSIVETQARVKAVEVFRDLAALPLFLGDKNQIQQVLVNLCNNAIDAMPDGGALTIRTRSVAAGAGPKTVVEIIDTGSGIASEIRGKIFDPFFTTKEVGRGTGLGLSLVYEIIQRHKGSIELESVLGRGTTFTLAFPPGNGIPAAAKNAII